MRKKSYFNVTPLPPIVSKSFETNDVVSDTETEKKNIENNVFCKYLRRYCFVEIVFDLHDRVLYMQPQKVHVRIKNR